MTSSGLLRSRWTRIKRQQGREGLVDWAQQSCSSWSSSWLWPGVGNSWVSSATQCCFVSWGLGGGLPPLVSVGKGAAAGFKDTFLCQFPPGAKEREVGSFVQHPRIPRGEWAEPGGLASPGNIHLWRKGTLPQTWQGLGPPSLSLTYHPQPCCRTGREVPGAAPAVLSQQLIIFLETFVLVTCNNPLGNLKR